MSLKLKILEEITKVYPNTYGIDEVFGIAALLGHKQSLAERKCRELVHAGEIKVIKDDKGYNRAYIMAGNPFKATTSPNLPPTSVLEPERYKEPTQSRLGIKLPPINL